MTTAINDSDPAVSPRYASRSPAVPRARWLCAGLGTALVADGAMLATLSALIGLPLIGPPLIGPPLIWAVLEAVLGAGVAICGLLIAQVAVTDRRPRPVGVLLPQIVLAAAMVYLATALSLFHTGYTAYPAAVSQFVAVLTGLGLGAAGLVLSGAATPPAGETGGVSFPIAARDGLILIVGAILIAIAIGQFAGARLTPPRWNWISFTGITIPGMMILVAREGVKQAYRRASSRSRPALTRWILTEVMLVAGLFVMYFGSIANLTLGQNGYAHGFAGNAVGGWLLVAAAVFLTVIRGPLKAATSTLRGRAAIARTLAGNVTLAGGAIAFFYGERSVILGKAPSLSFGGAFPAATVIAVAGLLILIAGRALARPASAALALGGMDEADERLAIQGPPASPVPLG